MNSKTGSLLLCLTTVLTANAATIQLSANVPSNAAPPVQSSFASLAVEFFFFPDLAGSSSSPNTLSQNLITQLARLQNANPILRVGGTSQDHALYNASLPLDTPYTRDNTTKAVQFGPGFFDAFKGLPNVDFTFGLNLAGNTSAAATSLTTVAKLICQKLGSSLAYWELGNEPDLFTAPPPEHGFRDNKTWHEQDYVNEWLQKSSAVTQAVTSVSSSCPNLLKNGQLSFVAPSFFDVNGHLNPVETWNDHLDKNGNIDEITGHIYIDSQYNSVSLQGTLMNHTRTVNEIDRRTNVWDQITQQSKTYFSFNEVGSLVPTGLENISNVFGAALWTMDFSLYAASSGVGRLHWQQGTGFWYEAWQPVGSAKGTRPPFYGILASAAFIGDSKVNRMRTIQLPVADSVQSSSYALYRNGTLERLAIIQMTAYNGLSSNRPSTMFTFQLPAGYAGQAIDARWLAAAGSDDKSGINFGSRTYETDDGTPAPQSPPVGSVGSYTVTTGGLLTVILPHSSAVILQFDG